VVGGGGSSRSVGPAVNRRRLAADRCEVGAQIDGTVADRRGADASKTRSAVTRSRTDVGRWLVGEQEADGEQEVEARVPAVGVTTGGAQ
jgi:hypothetical protein